MPYIDKKSREIVDKKIELLAERAKELGQGGRAGVFNYIITRLIQMLYPRDRYAELNEALGVLDAVAREFYRRRVAPYEDEKAKQNGDVY